MKKILINLSVMFATVGIFIPHAFANAPQTDISGIVLNNFSAASLQWIPTIKSYAITLFWMLALLDFTWMAINLALKKGNLYDIAFNMVRKILFLGFFYALLLFCWNPGAGGIKWIDDIINSFVQIGGAVPGGTENIAPGYIIEYTFDIYMKTMTGLSIFQGETWAMALASIVLLVVGVYMAGVMLLVLIEMYIATSIGVLLLGFGGSEWTKDYAISYMKYLITLGIKLMAIQLVGALAVNLYRGWATIPNLTLQELVALLIGLMLLAFIIKEIPTIISSIVSGGQISSNPIGVLGASVGMAAGIAAGGAVLAKSTTTGGATAMMALREATKAPGNTGGIKGTLSAIASAGARTVADNLGKAKAFRNPIIGGTYAEMRGARQESTLSNLGNNNKS